MPSPFGIVGNVKNFMNIVREVNFDEVRGRAESAPAILVCAEDEAVAGTFVRQVFGDDAIRHVDVRTDRFNDIEGLRYDIIVVVDPAGTSMHGAVRNALGTDADRKVVAPRLSTVELSAKEITTTQDSIVGLNSELAPALGRRFPLLQLAAVREIVDDTARANAQFALVSNIPALIPVIGGIVAAGADFIVLTKNQVMMVFKIAAVHDRDLSNQLKLMRELAPVVGTGFLWRTVAREAVSFLPLAAGTIPKVAIAYIGTVVMGRAADYFYRFGQKPTKEHLKAFTEKAAESASRLEIGKGDETAAGHHEREAGTDSTDRQKSA